MGVVMFNIESGAKMNQFVKLAKKLDVKGAMLTDEEIERIEDAKLLRRMEAALAEGFADTDDVLKKLGL